VKTLQEEKRVLEEKLEAFTPSSEDGREKALIIASEKKARGQVKTGYTLVIVTKGVAMGPVGGGAAEKV
jgi:hypothetical protein